MSTDDPVAAAGLEASRRLYEQGYGRNGYYAGERVGGDDTERADEYRDWCNDDDAEPGTEAEPPAPRIWLADDLAPAAQPRWLAANRIPRAAVSLVIGEEGIGKSLLWVWIVAAITRGAALPGFGIPARAPGRVLLAAITEDDWCSVVRPRLEVAGADLSRIGVICTERDGSGSAVFPKDVGLISEADPAPDLIVVDAWLDTVPAHLQVKDPQQARLALHAWKDLATATDAAVLLVCHTNRVDTANPRDRYGATSALRQKARMSLYCLTDLDTGKLIVGPEKANGAAAVTASMFTIAAEQYWAPTADHDGTVPKLVYSSETLETVRDVIAEAYAAGKTGDAGADTLAWLAAELGAGARWVSDISRAGEVAGYNLDKLKRAKRRLHAESTKDGVTGAWFWALPQHQGSTPAPSVAPLLPCSLAPLPQNQGSASSSKESKRANREKQGTECSLARPLASVLCRYCGDEIPETAPLARELGHCGKATCIAAANIDREEPDP
jgi:hypothetical protein